ncbi:unnamed protein product [Acanthoscelides obtectus]|uniref:Uncharacterized protein n=1 Tax=Acanthoscelides obtectus TaxID=200917 RepID=A0A9P0PNG5_ACAOB|nr:unnamed protein product [Acanthoscelides obtectus]CAK1669544.1 Cilia- and flagella-associated protein 100 [Acanthoscelides obtectus]
MNKKDKRKGSRSDMIEQLQVLFDSTSSLEAVPDFDRSVIEEQAKRRFKQSTRHFSQKKKILFDKRKYFTDNPRMNDENRRNLRDEPSWYGYPKDMEEFAQVRFRLAHPAQSKNVDTIAEDIMDDDIFAKYKIALDDAELTLSDIKEIANECQSACPADIYFKEPSELVEVFRYMELQNLNNLLYCEELSAPLETVKNTMIQAEKMFDKDIASLSEIIGRLESGIMWEEERAKYLEDYAKKLINQELRHLIIDDSILNLYVFVEDCFETRVAPNDANLTMLEMISGISKKYGDELLIMEKVPKEIISALGESCVQENMATMRLAEKAAKQVAELHRLTASLIKTFAPPYKKPPCKEPRNRSAVKRPPALKKVPSRKLTPEEEEYLEHFTDFCKYTDNPKDFGVDTSVMQKLARYQLKEKEDASEERIVFGASSKSGKEGKK